MRLDDYRFSENVEVQRGGPNLGGFGGGGGIIGLLLPLVLSRFGIVGLLVLALGYCALSSLGGGGSQVASGPAQSGAAGAASVCEASSVHAFSCRVLASTEDTWAALFQQSGARYTPTTLSFYDRVGRSGCGVAQSAMGPFYCPTDQRVYLDTTFFNELQTRFQAAGDFAQAYVIAHEVGHHVQNLEGTLSQASAAQARSSNADSNRIQVGIELQADCYAGVWAAHNLDRLEAGDIEEGMRAAEAIGDDTLQRRTQGRVVPESFTHGTSAQRMSALRQGLRTGNPNACNFNA